MRIFLDDVRGAPDGWALARTIEEAQLLLSTETVEEISLDHDLGACRACRAKFFQGLNDCQHVQSGYDLVLWMKATGYLPPIVQIHTMNPAGRRRMEQALASVS